MFDNTSSKVGMFEPDDPSRAGRRHDSDFSERPFFEAFLGQISGNVAAKKCGKGLGAWSDDMHLLFKTVLQYGNKLIYVVELDKEDEDFHESFDSVEIVSCERLRGCPRGDGNLQMEITDGDCNKYAIVKMWTLLESPTA